MRYDSIPLLANTEDKNSLILPQVERFIEWIDIKRNLQICGLCLGPSGVGKTVACHLYAWQCETLDILEPILLSLEGDKVDNKMLLEKILFYYKGYGRRTLPEMRQYVKRELGEEENLLIVDNADRLNKSALIEILDLHKNLQLPVILVGGKTLASNIKKEEMFEAYFCTKFNFTALESTELDDFLKLLLPDLDPSEYREVLERLQVATGGIPKNISKVVELATGLADRDGLGVVRAEDLRLAIANIFEQ